jgi:hypothetical protein
MSSSQLNGTQTYSFTEEANLLLSFRSNATQTPDIVSNPIAYDIIPNEVNDSNPWTYEMMKENVIPNFDSDTNGSESLFFTERTNEEGQKEGEEEEIGHLNKKPRLETPPAMVPILQPGNNIFASFVLDEEVREYIPIKTSMGEIEKQIDAMSMEISGLLTF